MQAGNENFNLFIYSLPYKGLGLLIHFGLLFTIVYTMHIYIYRS